MVETKGGMIRTEEAVRGIYESLGDDDPEKAKVWSVLQGVEYENRQPNYTPPTPEQLANLEGLAHEQLHEAYMGQSDFIQQLSLNFFKYEMVFDEEQRVVHEQVMKALDDLEAIIQESLRRRQSSSMSETE